MSDLYAKFARVASRITPYAVVINRGTSHGVSVGRRYVIFSLGPDVMDPETGESLGPIEIIGGRGRVANVQANMATIESDEYEEDTEIRRVIKRDMLYLRSETIEENEERIKAKIAAKIGDYAKPSD